jgi:hypothetical protein
MTMHLKNIYVAILNKVRFYDVFYISKTVFWTEVLLHNDFFFSIVLIWDCPLDFWFSPLSFSF